MASVVADFAAGDDLLREAGQGRLADHGSIILQKSGRIGPLVEIALQRLMKNGRTHFDHWDERLAKLLGPSTQEHCELILEITSRAPGGVSMATIDLRLSQKMADQKSRTEMLRQALDLLLRDGYLVQQGDVVRFRSSLLRRYWMELQA